MFRLYKAELKKIFLKPSIFVVTGLLILLLAISAFLYRPQTRSNFVVDYNSFNTALTNSCDTVQEVWDRFSTGNEVYSYAHNEQLLASAEAYINYYKNNKNNLELIQSRYQSVYNSCVAYQQTFAGYETAYLNAQQYPTADNQTTLANSKTGLDAARNKFLNDFETFYDFYKGVINDQKTTVLVTETLDKTLFNFYGSFDRSNYVRLVDSGLNDYEANKSYLQKLFPNTSGAYFLDTLDGYIDQLIAFDVDQNVVEDMPNILTEGRSWLGDDNSGLYQQILDYYTAHQASDNPAHTKEIIKLVTDYNLAANYISKIVTNSIRVTGLHKLGTVDIQQFAPFKKSNLYQIQEELTKVNYLFDVKDFEYNYASVFSINQPSNENINGFDYSYFALRLCTLFIVVYIVVLAAGTIAGEQSSGTMKMLAIRPFSRNKLLTSKMGAIFTVGAILLVVSSLATLVIGGISYGFASAPMLVIADASLALPMGAFWVYSLAFFTMFLEILFYASLSIFISIVFKSHIGAVTVSILLFFVSLVLNVVAVNVPILRFLPFTNVNLFKYFGASFISTNSAQNVLQGILTPSVFVGANLTFSYIYYMIVLGLLEFFSFFMFKKRDIK